MVEFDLTWGGRGWLVAGRLELRLSSSIPAATWSVHLAKWIILRSLKGRRLKWRGDVLEVWPKSDKGFFLFPPLLRRVAGRPKTLRIKASHEPGTKSTGTEHKFAICKGYKHHWKSCKDGDPAAKEVLAALAAKMKAEKKRATKKAIAQALASIGPSCSAGTNISACGSNEIEAPNGLAIVPAAAVPSLAVGAAPFSSVADGTTKKKKLTSRKTIKEKPKEKKASEPSAPKKGKKRSEPAAPKKEKTTSEPTAPKKGKKRSITEAKASTPSKKSKKISVAASPSTPSMCKIPQVAPNSPAMGTRSKVKERSLTDLLAS